MTGAASLLVRGRDGTIITPATRIQQVGGRHEEMVQLPILATAEDEQCLTFQGVTPMTTPSYNGGTGNPALPDAQEQANAVGRITAKGSRVTFTGDISGLARGWRFAGSPPRQRWIVRPTTHPPSAPALQQTIDANDDQALPCRYDLDRDQIQAMGPILVCSRADQSTCAGWRGTDTRATDKLRGITPKTPPSFAQRPTRTGMTMKLIEDWKDYLRRSSATSWFLAGGIDKSSAPSPRVVGAVAGRPASPPIAATALRHPGAVVTIWGGGMLARLSGQRSWTPRSPPKKGTTDGVA